jgi:type I restriction enzyme S subunit
MILIRPGDLVISGINAAKGAIAIYGEENTEPIAATIHYGAYIPNKQRVDPRYLWWLLRSGTFRDLLVEHVPGGIKTELKAKRLLPIPIPLPPLAEQRRTVARIEELTALIEEARALRVKAREEAVALLNSELASIYAILVERNGAHQLGDLILNGGYGTSTKCNYEPLEGAVPVLRIPNVASERVNFDDIKYGVLSEADLKRVLIAEGDILVVRTCGSADLVGRCAVVPPLSEPTAFASYLIRLQCDPGIVSPNYLQLMLKHLRTDGQLFDFARTTAGQYNVSLGRLRAAKIPVPPLSDQRRIVAYLDGLQAQVDELAALQDATQAELDALLPSVLDQAFRGEL